MPKGAALLIGIGKPKGDYAEDEDMDEGSDDVKAEAGEELASAIKSGDGRRICEAVKAIMELESYEDDED